jgi:hypothetical protein
MTENKNDNFIVYTRQSEAFENAIDNQFFFASDINDKGSKEYGSILDVDSFLKVYGKQSRKNFYEVIKEKQPRYEYFDVDIKFEPGDSVKTPEQVFKLFYNIHNKYKRYAGYDFADDFYITDSSKINKKVSLHIVNRAICFKDLEEHKKFMDDFKSYKDSHFPEDNIGVDYSVYSSNRCMRIIDSSKYGENRPLGPAHFHYDSKCAGFEKFFITNVDKHSLKKSNVILNKHQKEQEKEVKKVVKEQKAFQVFEQTETLKGHFDEEADEITELVCLILRSVEEKSHSLCDSEYPDKMNYMNFRNLTFAYINSCKNSVPQMDLDYSFFESDIFPIYRHGSGCDPLQMWNGFLKSQTSKPYTVKSLHYWARQNPDYNERFTRQLTEYDIKKYKFDEKYYWGDFISDMTQQIFPSHSTLKKSFIENINRVCIVELTASPYFHLKKDTSFEESSKLEYKFRYREKEVDKSGTTKEKMFSAHLDDLITGNFEHIKVFKSVIFRPYDVINVNFIQEPGIFNKYNGMLAKYNKNINYTYLKYVLDHIEIVWCNRDQKKFKFIKSWLASIIKTPWKKTQKAIVLQSTEQGIGKGIIAEFFINCVFGKQIAFKTPDITKLTQRFNGLIEGKIFGVVDEGSSHTEYSSNVFDIMKSLISDEICTVEGKGKETKTIHQYLNLMFLTNHSNSYSIESTDRRYVVFKCNSEKLNNVEYFKDLAYILEQQETADSVLSYFYDYEPEINIMEPFITEEKKEMIYDTAKQPMKFLYDIERKDFTLVYKPAEYPLIASNVLFENFKQWCHANSLQSKYDVKSFSREVKPYVYKGETKKRLETCESLFERKHDKSKVPTVSDNPLQYFDVSKINIPNV